MLQCYNKGCGQQFDPEKNTEESCRHHPGVPFFHDAFKGWTCCNKKSIDFTEFLNIKGCELSKHSNVKPIEPEKLDTTDDVVITEPVKEPPKLPAPLPPKSTTKRPINDPLIKIEPIVAPGLKQAIDELKIDKISLKETGSIAVGTICKNGGCNCSYESEATDKTVCMHHPGQPVFHEGLKYWSCCNKQTTDFQKFLEQAGCTNGTHKWFQEANETNVMNCRYDWHQTTTQIVISVYAKQYHYEVSSINLNPVRLVISLVFPKQNNAMFTMDLELYGIIDVSKATVHMYGTKVEITLFKLEPGSWPKLNYELNVRNETITDKRKETETVKSKVIITKDDSTSDSDFDLEDIDAVGDSGIKITEV